MDIVSAHASDEIQGEPLLVPLTIPMVAGPSAMAVIMLLSTNQPGRMTDWLPALLEGISTYMAELT